jgi:quercetin dioxygenase-like cupin family protein
VSPGSTDAQSTPISLLFGASVGVYEHLAKETLMPCSRSIRWVCLVVGTFILTAPLASGQSAKVDQYGFVAAQPEDLRPAEGSTQIRIMGDPTKPGMYVVRNTFPANRTGTPHFHNQDRYITVLKGTWWVSLGPESDSGDPNKMIPIKAGGYVFHPANGHHFDGTKGEEATVQIIGMGPVTSTQVKSAGGTAQR